MYVCVCVCMALNFRPRDPGFLPTTHVCMYVCICVCMYGIEFSSLRSGISPLYMCMYVCLYVTYDLPLYPRIRLLKARYTHCMLRLDHSSYIHTYTHTYIHVIPFYLRNPSSQVAVYQLHAPTRPQFIHTYIHTCIHMTYHFIREICLL